MKIIEIIIVVSLQAAHAGLNQARRSPDGPREIALIFVWAIVKNIRPMPRLKADPDPILAFQLIVII